MGQVRGINPLMEIAVKADGPRKAEEAADALAERVVENVSTYVSEKVGLLERQVDGQRRRSSPPSRRGSRRRRSSRTRCSTTPRSRPSSGCS